MNNAQLEEALRTALNRAAPDNLEGVLSRCAPREGRVIPLEPKKRRSRARSGLLAACLALVVLGGGTGYYLHQTAQRVASVVLLDVNPSVTLTVNKAQRVLSAVPANDDGADILDGMDLRGTQLEVAMNAIVGSLLKHGYVDQLANSILITVEDDDQARGDRLQRELTSQADAVLAGAQVSGAILSQTIQAGGQLEAQAAEYGISAGKAALVQTIVEESGGLYAFGDLAGLTINDLNLLYSSLSSPGVQQPESPGIHTSGTASDGAYIGAQAARQAALDHAGLTSGDAVQWRETDFDFEDGRMVYELEFYARDTEYEYEIDALTGAVLQAKPEGTGTQRPPAQTGGADSSGDRETDIGREQAIALALRHAGVDQSQLRELEAERDREDGRIVYEIEFSAGGWTYEYTVAGDGSILEFEKDQD